MVHGGLLCWAGAPTMELPRRGLGEGPASLSALLRSQVALLSPAQHGSVQPSGTGMAFICHQAAALGFILKAVIYLFSPHLESRGAGDSGEVGVPGSTVTAVPHGHPHSPGSGSPFSAPRGPHLAQDRAHSGSPLLAISRQRLRADAGPRGRARARGSHGRFPARESYADGTRSPSRGLFTWRCRAA